MNDDLPSLANTSDTPSSLDTGKRGAVDSTLAGTATTLLEVGHGVNTLEATSRKSTSSLGSGAGVRSSREHVSSGTSGTRGNDSDLASRGTGVGDTGEASRATESGVRGTVLADELGLVTLSGTGVAVVR